ncbi:MAG: YesL family protein [Lachnospiraceae bacterium]
MQLFSLDSPIMRFLSKVADLMILNIIFWICCIPIVTIGASATALYSITLKMVKNEESYIFRGFFRAFKENFKISTGLWILTALVGLVIYVDFYVAPQMASPLNMILQVLLTALLIFYIFTLLYLFPYVARFQNTWKATIKNAFLIGIANLPFTLLMVLFVALMLFLTYVVNLAIVLPIWMLCGFSVIAYVKSFIIRRVFRKYEPEED